jgi:hypothetical protein
VIGERHRGDQRRTATRHFLPPEQAGTTAQATRDAALVEAMSSPDLMEARYAAG